jgi:hypothetical protein
MINECSYTEAVELAKSIRNKTYGEKVIGFVFVLSDCDVCGPWVEEVIVPVGRMLEQDLDLYIVYVDKEWIPFPPPNVPTTYFYIPNDINNEQAISREGPAEYGMVLEDVSRLVKMKTDGISLQDAFYQE